MNPQEKVHSTSTMPTYRPPPTLPQDGSTFVSITFIPPEINRPSAIPPLTIAPPVEQFVKRDFLCNMYILQQANPAYDDKSHFEYTQASQMILNAVCLLVCLMTIAFF